VGSIASASIGACIGIGDEPRNSGEIVSFTPDRHSFPRSGSSATASPDPRACQSAAAHYVRWPDPSWAPVSVRTIVLLGPDFLQYLSGQQWLACAVIPAHDGYTGSIGSVGRGANPSAADAFGQCRLKGGPEPLPASCSHPHDSEIFGTAVGESRDGADLVASCLALLTAVTGLSDPTAGGQLLLQLGPDRALGRRNCGVQASGDRQLVHSVLNWGSEPLPWAQ